MPRGEGETRDEGDEEESEDDIEIEKIEERKS